MGKLLVTENEIVFPGQELADGMDYLPGDDVYREKDILYASRIGMTKVSGRLIKLVPLAGPYIPKAGDAIVGTVVNVGLGGWRLDIGWMFEANLSVKEAVSEFVERTADLSKYFDYGDYIVAQIINVTNPRVIDLTTKGPGFRKLDPGRIIKVEPTKVPRIIGKQGSMISMIKEYTNCKITVGQNGIAWISGENPEKELLAVKAIEKIQAESHISGLTERVKEFLERGK